MENNPQVIHTRELFDLLGTEKISVGGRGVGHISTKTLKSWILKDLAKDLQIDNINNTKDKDKPLSTTQQLYIDGSLSDLISLLDTLQIQIVNLDDKLTKVEDELSLLKNNVL